MASGSALDLSLLGRHLSLGQATATTAKLDGVAKTIDAKATGLGIGLTPGNTVEAVLGGAQGTKKCAVPPLSSLMGQLTSVLPTLADVLPVMQLDVACGSASALGDLSNFVVRGDGSVANITVALSPAIKGLVAQVKGQLTDTVLKTPIGALVDQVDTTSQAAVNQLNGLLAQVLSPAVGTTVTLPVLGLKSTVLNALDRLQDTDLVRVSIGNAIARNIGDPTSFLAAARDEGGVIQILPDLIVDANGVHSPLLSISTAVTEASVKIDRLSAAATGTATNTLVSIDSGLLPEIPLGQMNVAGVISLKELATKLGYKSSVGHLELSPGQSVVLFPNTPLESAISVAKASDPVKLPDGGLRVESSAVSVHLLRGLGSLPVLSDAGFNLGTILANKTVDSALAPILGAAGLSLGDTTDTPGIKLDLAKSVAEASGARAVVSPAEVSRSLPRTGGTPVDAAPYAVPTLLGAAGGLRMFLRRRRTA
jgi:hypothetical protein